MVISEAAIIGLDRLRPRMERWVSAILPARRGNPRIEPDDLSPEEIGAEETEEVSQAGRTVLVAQRGTELTATERRARAAAVRGLMLARKRRYGAAQAAFAEAARFDAGLDLSDVPTFWELPRGGQEAAVRAYEEVGRLQDAGALEATLRSTFRPRAVPALRRAAEEG